MAQKANSIPSGYMPMEKLKEVKQMKYEPVHYIEDPFTSRKTVENETVRANNKRIDQGKPTKKIPRGAAGAKLWKPEGKKATRKRASGK